MGPLGGPEMAFIFFLALLLFGPKKLPELARTAGKGLAEFKRLKSEWKDTVDRETAHLGQGTEELTGLANQYRAELSLADLPSYESSYASSHGSESYVPLEGVSTPGTPVTAECSWRVS